MQLRNLIGRLWIALGLAAACAAHAAVIYKWTDAEGVIHYSDQAVPGAEKIVTASGSSNGIGGASRAPASSGPRATPPSHLEYTVFAIESPAKEQVFFGGEVIPVRLHLEPEMKPNQSIAWHMNGSLLNEQADSLAFALQTLPRGAYQLSATITDLGSGTSQTTDSITFFVRQPSELAPQHKRP